MSSVVVVLKRQFTLSVRQVVDVLYLGFGASSLKDGFEPYLVMFADEIPGLC